MLLCGAENVRLDRLNAGAALLDSHRAGSVLNVIGSVVPGSARMSGGVGLATVRLSRAPGDADTVSKIADGIIRSISCGYITHAVIRTEATDGSLPTMTATDWEPVELSAVPVPADPGAQFRAAIPTHEATVMSETDAGREWAKRLLRKSATVAEMNGAHRAIVPADANENEAFVERGLAERLEANRHAEREAAVNHWRKVAGKVEVH